MYMKHLATTFLFISFLATVKAHARIRYPRPLAAPVETPAGNYYNGPLRADGGDFPCKGLHKRADIDKTPTVTWKAGEQAYFEILGHGPTGGEGCLAAHSGGSCQASISFDNGVTWKVLHSFQGGCPRGARLNSNMASNDQVFRFHIPEDTRAGNALFSWSWVAVTGNRNEFYQNCASIRIDGSGTSTLDNHPDMFVGDMTLTGHIGSRECRSTAGYSLEYPNPGTALTSTPVSGIGFKKPTNGKCYAQGSRENITPVIPLPSSTIAPGTVIISRSTTPSLIVPSSPLIASSPQINVESTTTPSLIVPSTPIIASSPQENEESTTPTSPLPPGSKPSQCFNYMTITDKTRRTIHPHYITCDKGFFKAKLTWVRFQGDAGTRLAPGPLDGFRCSTQGTGWYKGSYPTAIGATITGTVCYGWPGNSCQWSNKISITNCDGYYVFELPPPPACYLRYCTV